MYSTKVTVITQITAQVTTKHTVITQITAQVTSIPQQAPLRQRPHQ